MSTEELLGRPDEILGGNLVIDWHPIQGGVVTLLVAWCFMETGKSSSYVGQKTGVQTLSLPLHTYIHVKPFVFCVQDGVIFKYVSLNQV